MFFKLSIFSLGLALLPLVSAEIHDVKVGSNGGLIFEPEAISAQPGDQVVFHFVSKNHSVTQTSLNDPCSAKDGGFDTGFMPVAANQTDNFPTYTIEVKDTQPIWAFCRQAAATANSHCGAGMVFSVNCGPDGAPNSFTNFKSSALAIGAKLKEEAASSSTSASGGYGGGYGGGGYGGGYGGSTATESASGTEPTSTTQATTGAAGKEIKVVVGGAGAKLTFDPPRISANPQDVVIFEFQQKNHSIVQSTFDAPCSPKDSGFKTDFFAVDDGATTFPTWRLTVNDTTPVWVYCRQKSPKSHCGAGMVFAINSADDTQKSFTAFQKLAEQQGSSNTTASGATSTGSDNGAISSRGLTMGLALVVPALIASLL
jgi:plastocyanin